MRKRGLVRPVYPKPCDTGGG